METDSSEVDSDTPAAKLKLLVITCWCGRQGHADMTGKMLLDLKASLDIANVDWQLGLFSQSDHPEAMVPLPPGMMGKIEHGASSKNLGFAAGMNRALRAGMRYFSPDLVLCINNDIEMPNPGWFNVLLHELEDNHILCPTTNYTSVHEQRSAGYEDRDPVYHGVTPGLCWLMPISIVRTVQEHIGGDHLFPEDLGGRAWGEDNYTAGVVRTLVNPVPFKIVPRAWINHLGAKTSCFIPAAEKMKCHREAHARMRKANFK